jgi:mono/diheme cytochrome c family protein
VAQRRRKNPWVSATEVLVWVLFALLLVPAGFAGWALGHYTSLAKSSGTKTVTTTVTAAATTSSSTPTTTAAAGSGGNAAAGKSVFASNGCAACHTFKAAGASGTVGPDLDTAPAADAKSANMTLAAFLKQSIVDPNAFIAKGYPKGVMPATFGTSLTSTQLADLVAFLGG